MDRFRLAPNKSGGELSVVELSAQGGDVTGSGKKKGCEPISDKQLNRKSQSPPSYKPSARSAIFYRGGKRLSMFHGRDTGRSDAFEENTYQRIFIKHPTNNQDR